MDLHVLVFAKYRVAVLVVADLHVSQVQYGGQGCKHAGLLTVRVAVSISNHRDSRDFAI